MGLRNKIKEKIGRISKVLSEPFPHARIDLYEISGKVVFGEITMYPSDGLDKFDPENQDFIIGEMLELPVNSK